MQLYYCKICKKSLPSSGFTMHMRSHDKSFILLNYIKENLELFPKYKLCDICGINITNVSRTYSTCSMECRKKAQAKHHLGRNIWAEMSPETREIASKKLSEKAFINGQGRNIWAEMPPEVYKLAKERHKAKVNNSGVNNPMYGKTHTMEAVEKIFKYRSVTSIEQLVKDFLEKHNINYTFQFFIRNVEEEKTYAYDFKINKKKLLIEVDGDYWHGGPGLKQYHNHVEETKIRDKIKTELALNKGYRILRFWESEIKKTPESLNLILEEIKKENN